MNLSDNQTTSDAILEELETARRTFHALLDNLRGEAWIRQSINPGWKNYELCAHMLFGFIVIKNLLPMVRLWGKLPRRSSKLFANLLNNLTTPFNWINEKGARFQGKAFSFARMNKLFDTTIDSLMKKVKSFTEDEWKRGMHFPTRWDPNFKDFMTLADLFHYPVNHLQFHVGQIALRNFESK